jgi:hypothetical protein
VQAEAGAQRSRRRERSGRRRPGRPSRPLNEYRNSSQHPRRCRCPAASVVAPREARCVGRSSPGHRFAGREAPMFDETPDSEAAAMGMRREGQAAPPATLNLIDERAWLVKQHMLVRRFCCGWGRRRSRRIRATSPRCCLHAESLAPPLAGVTHQLNTICCPSSGSRQQPSRHSRAETQRAPRSAPGGRGSGS